MLLMLLMFGIFEAPRVLSLGVTPRKADTYLLLLNGVKAHKGSGARGYRRLGLILACGEGTEYAYLRGYIP